MLPIVLASLALAGVVALAAQAFRRQRTLAAEVHTLRGELRRACEALAARGRDPRPTPTPMPTTPGLGAADPASGQDEPDDTGPRTLH